MIYCNIFATLIIFGLSVSLADKIFVTYPVTGGAPMIAGKSAEIQWEPVIESATAPFPDKIGIDLMTGADSAASKAMTIVGKTVDPRSGSYKWDRVPKSLDPNPPGGGYFLRLGSVADGYFYGSRFQIKGLTGGSDPDDTTSAASMSNSTSNASDDDKPATASTDSQKSTDSHDDDSTKGSTQNSPPKHSDGDRNLFFAASFVTCTAAMVAAVIAM